MKGLVPNGTCNCPNGYTGDNCEIQNLCYNKVCSGYGTCDGGVCTCDGGWLGDNCEIQDLCYNKDCSGYGTCEQGVCQCDAGWVGDNCEIQDLCYNKDCSGNGTCEEGVCTCDGGWLGDNCEIQDLCYNKDCSGNGTCEEGVCQCDAGWVGENCENIDPCINIDCGLFGSCIDGKCICVNGWVGENCEQNDTCYSRTCINGGTCENGVCQCPPGFSGDNCEIDADWNGIPSGATYVEEMTNQYLIDNGYIDAVNDKYKDIDIDLSDIYTTVLGEKFCYRDNTDFPYYIKSLKLPIMVKNPENTSQKVEIKSRLLGGGAHEIDTLDMTPCWRVEVIGDSFCNQTKITKLDFNLFKNLESIGNSFCNQMYRLTEIKLGGITKITTIPAFFLSNCQVLTFLDLGFLENVTSISSYFLNNTQSLEYVNLGGFKNNLTSVSSTGLISNSYNLTTVRLNQTEPSTALINRLLPLGFSQSNEVGLYTREIEFPRVNDNQPTNNTYVNTITNQYLIDNNYLPPPSGNSLVVTQEIDLSTLRVTNFADSFAGWDSQSASPTYFPYRIANIKLPKVIGNPQNKYEYGKIWDNFMRSNQQETIDGADLANVTRIGNSFLTQSTTINLDLSSLTKVEVIGTGFCGSNDRS